jgi:glyoxylase-like metal-dependent hydrolase (beta-lactamase superfamily II)
MQLKGFLFAAGLTALTLTGLMAQSKLKIEVYTSGPAGLQSTSTLIEGPRNILLVDAQLTQSDANKVIEKIKATGKTLMAIVITSANPEHYFGLTAFRAAYPKIKIWAIPSVITGINAGFETSVKMWKPLLGDEVPARAIVPYTVPGASIFLDNEQVYVYGPVQGANQACSYLFIPTDKTLIAGDIVFNKTYAFTAETNAGQRKDWVDNLEKLKKLGAGTVVAGHKDPAAPDDATSLDETIRYLKTYDKAVKEVHSAEELIGVMDDQFPDLKGLDTALKISAAKQFPDNGQ